MYIYNRQVLRRPGHWPGDGALRQRRPLPPRRRRVRPRAPRAGRGSGPAGARDPGRLPLQVLFIIICGSFYVSVVCLDERICVKVTNYRWTTVDVHYVYFHPSCIPPPPTTRIPPIHPTVHIRRKGKIRPLSLPFPLFHAQSQPLRTWHQP